MLSGDADFGPRINLRPRQPALFNPSMAYNWLCGQQFAGLYQQLAVSNQHSATVSAEY
jgi:hypothetical protein